MHLAHSSSPSGVKGDGPPEETSPALPEEEAVPPPPRARPRRWVWWGRRPDGSECRGTSRTPAGCFRALAREGVDLSEGGKNAYAVWGRPDDVCLAELVDED